MLIVDALHYVPQMPKPVYPGPPDIDPLRLIYGLPDLSREIVARADALFRDSIAQKVTK